ncbi:unnamed protein product [Darwinula stevensoni]|uniref:Uncharacterized protein n=1 Tax=Darwinula stevensoni TaxID=69355 RepID=A0A7R8X4X7_9CRUS|nr:unnamed protein product [Darwinula stevensoni]CAG0884052.1 unnamed protein product [Darwinula stevensoni]
MTTFSRTALVLAGICGSLFVGYCIYFDRKRRNDPDFKKKLKEKRKQKKVTKNSGADGLRASDLKDPESVQRFFLQEVQLGEEYLAMGQIEEAVEHLCNAVAVCGQPSQLLQVLQQTLPPNVFQMLITKLPTVGERLFPQSQASVAADEDVE